MVYLSLWLAIATLPLISVLWTASHLISNYLVARKVGIPLIILPVDPSSPLWMMVSDAFGKHIDRLLSWTSYGRNTFARYAHRGWDFKDGAKTFEEVGDTFILVTTGKNWLYLCNADTLVDLLQRRADFKRPPEIVAVLDVFGPNLSTVDGKDWQRHRKITGPPFGEPTMDRVWAECLDQAQQMLEYWQHVSDIRHTIKDVRRFSLHVLSATGFGVSHPFDPAMEEKVEPGSMSYKDALQLILENSILLMLCGPKFLCGNFKYLIPKHWALVGEATQHFKKHIAKTINDEKESGRNSGNFISAMAKASRKGEEVVAGKRQHLNGLSESEVFGNIYVFNFAGHDSIAITLTYAITHLAAHPEIQDWLAEEIAYVCNDYQKGDQGYRETFPRLKRCTAVIYETLRTSTPFPAIAKTTGHTSKTLTVGDKTLTLPPNMNIIQTFHSIHKHSRYWGSDAEVWKPQRWITQTTRADSKNVFENETLVEPYPGSFLPFADGERQCPGQKFAKVELVGAVSTLFAKGWRVEPVPESSTESAAHARARAEEVIQDSGMVLLMEMLHPEKLGLRWVNKRAAKSMDS